MKSIKSIGVSLLLCIALISCQAQTGKYDLNIDDSKIALQGYSPVSYVDLGLAQRGNKAFKSEYQGAKYYFTDADQKNKFDKNPGKYLPEFGGYCAFGVYAGAKFRTDPNKFLVSKGKLYLFLYDLEVDAMQLWKAENEAKLLETAQANWQKLQDRP